MSKRWETSSQGMLAVNSILAGFCVTAICLILTLTEKSIILELSLGSMTIAFIFFTISCEWITDAIDYQEIDDYIQSMLTYNLGVIMLFVAAIFLFIHYQYYFLVIIAFLSMFYWIHHELWLLNKENRKRIVIDTTCEIQRISPNDSKNIINDLMYLEKLFPQNLQEIHKDLEKMIQNPTNICITAEIDNVVEGYLLSGPLKNFDFIPGITEDAEFYSDSSIYIMSIIVSPHFRKKEIGQCLISELYRIARLQGYRYITAHTKEKSYRPKDIEVLKIFPNWYGSSDSYEYWRRRVPSTAFFKQH